MGYFTASIYGHHGDLTRFITMPDVGLTSADAPLSPGAKIVIKYTVEVEGLPVYYQESYDVRKLAEELRADREAFKELWLRRVECVVKASDGPRFSATLTDCLTQESSPAS